MESKPFYTSPLSARTDKCLTYGFFAKSFSLSQGRLSSLCVGDYIRTVLGDSTGNWTPVTEVTVPRNFHYTTEPYGAPDRNWTCNLRITRPLRYLLRHWCICIFDYDMSTIIVAALAENIFQTRLDIWEEEAREPMSIFLQRTTH